MVIAFKEKGIWWFPNTPENKFEGIISFEPSQVPQLKLTKAISKIGKVTEIFKEKINIKTVNDLHKFILKQNDVTIEKFDIILGYCDNNKYTLLYCYTSIINGLIRDLFHCEIIIKGAHFNSIEDINIFELQVKYSNLEEWINISGFEKSSIEDLLNRTLFNAQNNITESSETVNITYNKPNKIQLSNTNDFIISNDFEFSSVYTWLIERNIKQSNYLNIKFFSERNIETCIDLLNHMKYFFHLVTHSNVKILQIKGYSYSNMKNESYDNKYTKFKYEPFFIFIYNLENEKNIELILPGKMTFTYIDYKDRINGIINTWIDNQNKLIVLNKLFFDVRNSNNPNIEQVFISYTQAIEGFHKLMINDKPMTFYNRLVDLCRIYDVILNRKIYNDDLLILIKDTRNFYTHLLPEPNKKVAQGEELYFITEKLSLFLEIGYLNLLGFDNNEIKKMLIKYIIYKQYIS